jgi:hypothetical protein
MASLYTYAHYFKLGLTKVPAVLTYTEMPQGWHKPRGEKIAPEPNMETIVRKPNTKSAPDSIGRGKDGVKSTIYESRVSKYRSNDPVKLTRLINSLKSENPKFGFSYITRWARGRRNVAFLKRAPFDPCAIDLLLGDTNGSNTENTTKISRGANVIIRKNK